MLAATPPRFIPIIVSLFLVIISATICWSWFGELEIMVNAPGILVPITNMSVVRNVVDGAIDELLIKDGQRVKVGEVLFSVASGLARTQLENAIKEKKQISERIKELHKIHSEFSKIGIEEQQNYNYMNTSFSGKSNGYLAYQGQYNQFLIKFKQAENQYILGCKINTLTPQELEILKTNKIFARLTLETFVYETLTKIEAEILEKNSLLRQVENRITELDQTLVFSVIRAPISGAVEFLQGVNVGDFVPAGTEILRIIPENDDGLQVELSVANRDIGKIEPGQEITYSFLGLPYREAGIFKGTVTNIANYTNLLQGVPTYKIIGTIEQSLPQDGVGNSMDLKAGMICEGRVAIRQEKIIFILLEKLNLYI